MLRKSLFATTVIIGLIVVCIRFAPISGTTYRDVAHYAVAVRKNPSCDLERSFTDELVSDAAFWFIFWNRPGHKEYIESGRGLLRYTLGKVKCNQDSPRFLVESQRAIRAMNLAVSLGEDVHSQDRNGNSPLHVAVLSGNHLLVEYLLERGASPESENAEGETPIELLYSLTDAEIGYDGSQIEPLLLAWQTEKY